MAGNKAVAYIKPGVVEVQEIDYPKLELRDGPGVNPANVGRKCPHGVILKVVSTNICGSDQHMVRGRTTAPQGLALGHEITGEVVEALREDGDAPQRLIITSDRIDGAKVRALLEMADRLGIPLSRMPRLTDFRSSEDEEKLQIRPIALEDLLGRPQTV